MLAIGNFQLERRRYSTVPYCSEGEYSGHESRVQEKQKRTQHDTWTWVFAKPPPRHHGRLRRLSTSMPWGGRSILRASSACVRRGSRQSNELSFGQGRRARQGGRRRRLRRPCRTCGGPHAASSLARSSGEKITSLSGTLSAVTSFALPWISGTGTSAPGFHTLGWSAQGRGGDPAL